MEHQITKLDLFNLALKQQYNGLIFEGFKVGTFIFGAATLKIADELGNIFQSQISFKAYDWKGWIFNRINRALKKIFENQKYRDWLSKYIHIPSIFYPRYTHEIGGHKFVMWDGEPDISIRNILKEYRSLTEWEPKTTELIQELAKDKVCIDIGASIGPLTLQMCRVAHKVIAVEPTERCFRYLCQNLEINGYKNCVPLRFAAWDKNEVVTMPINDPNPNYVNGICMDDWLEKQGITKIDFIKIDVDGSEPRVLQGLIRTFERNPHLKMIIEYYPLYILGGGQDPDKFMEILKKYFTWEVIPDDFSENCWNLLCTRNELPS